VVPAEADEEGGEEEPADDEGGEDEGGEDEFELEGDLYAGHFYEEDEAEEEEEEVVEIDESMLRRELRRMRRLREETAGVDEPRQTADAFGGGDVEDEAFVDVDEDSLLNALADELGDAPTPTTGGRPPGGDAMPESRRRRRNSRARRTNEARKVRALQKRLAEYAKAVKALRKQCNEMNLFNAKLLYANKLMQNRNVTPKQQRAVVEALDNAKTLREAKLLYSSLAKSISTRGNKSTLRESRVRTPGSSSRSTRSAQSAKSGVEVDRWAVLAGLPGKNN
jgi:hypothetical protein